MKALTPLIALPFTTIFCLGTTVLLTTLPSTLQAQRYIIIEQEECNDSNRQNPYGKQYYRPVPQSLTPGYYTPNSVRSSGRTAKEFGTGYDEGRNDAQRVLSAKGKKDKREAEARAFDADKNYLHGSPDFRAGYEQGYVETIRRCKK